MERPECQERVWVLSGTQSQRWITLRCGGEGDGGVKGDSGISPATLLTQHLPESI